MRIPSTKIWLAAALTLGTRVARGDSQPALVFSARSFKEFGNYDNGDPVFVVNHLDRPSHTSGVAKKTFNWTTSDPNLRVEKVNLFFWNETALNSTLIAEGAEDPSSQATTTKQSFLPIPTSATGLGSSPRGLLNGVGLNEKLETILTVSSDSVTIEDVTKLNGYSSQLYFEAVWLNKGGNGKSYSRAFAVVTSDEEAAAALARPGTRLSVSSPFFPDVNSTANGASPAGSTSSATSTSTSEAPGQQNEGGLATGAIIGIAVACGILGLLLILGAAWFLIRRRNQQAGNTNYGSPGRPYGTERRRTDELIAEKEASAGGADPSPHSPYSDDGVVLVPSASAGHTSTYHNGGGGSNSAIALGTPVVAPVLPQQIPRIPPPHDHHHQQQQQQQQQPGPYATYSERGSIGALGGGSPSTHAASITHSIHDETANRAGMGSPTAGRATPHSSLAPQYAHLVEEGMTEDEIRRLEDEERQLDAEIERAGRR